MDDYSDIVYACFALLFAALLLVAGLLFILGDESTGRRPVEVQPPSKSNSVSGMIS